MNTTPYQEDVCKNDWIDKDVIICPKRTDQVCSESAQVIFRDDVGF